MRVDCKTVQGRRKLRFESFDDLVADAARLVASPDTKMLGNWPLEQLLAHLTLAINGSIDGISVRAPWFIRLMGPYLRRHILRNGMSPGFNLPKAKEAAFFPAVTSAQAELAAMRQAVGRLQNEKMTAKHPVLGKLTHDQWAQLHLRHAELHLSFASPGT